MVTKFLTAREIWDGYDVHALPLKSSTISESASGFLVRKTVSYLADSTEEGDVIGAIDVFFDSRWADERAAVLIVPNLGSSLEDAVDALVKEGYVVGVADYTGERIVDGTTYPKRYEYATLDGCKNKLETLDGDALSSPYYIWTKVLRRAINVLEEQPFVETGRIAVLGLGLGAQLAWLVAGTDQRVKALVPISGGGYVWALKRPRFQFDNVPVTDDESAFSTGVGAETYARFVTCPTFYMTSRMSRFSDVDRAGDILKFVRSKNRQLLIMGSMEDRLSQAEFQAMLGWLRTDFEFGGNTSPEPTGSFENRDGFLYLHLRSDKIAQKLKAYISYGEPISAARSWQSLSSPQLVGQDEYAIKIPVYDEKELIVAYATFTYEDGIMASTPIAGVVPATLNAKKTEKVKETSHIIYDGSMDVSPFIALTDDLIQKEGVIFKTKGPFDIMGVTSSDGGIALCRSTSEMASLDRLSALHFDAYSKDKRELEVSMFTYPEMRRFSATLRLQGGEFWQKILLVRGDFKSEEGMTLSKFSDTKVLVIFDAKGVLFNNFVWI